MGSFLAPLKRFGQHFLVDANIIEKMIKAMDVKPQDDVLEIGPGRGALTFAVAEKARRLVALEVDRGYCRQLKNQTKGHKNTTVICGDILKFDLKAYVRKARIKSLKVIGNLPYNLTAPIIEYLIKNLKHINSIFITVQREAGERLAASPGSKVYGSLTCFVNFYCRPKILFKIKSGSFWPKPKVESCFIRLVPLPDNGRGFSVKSRVLFFEVVRRSFNQRRKRLYASLSQMISRTDLNRLGHSELLSRRPEDLSLEDFAAVSNDIFDFLKKR